MEGQGWKAGGRDEGPGYQGLPTPFANPGPWASFPSALLFHSLSKATPAQSSFLVPNPISPRCPTPQPPPTIPPQAMFMMAWRITRLHEEGRLTHEQASLAKVGWNGPPHCIF